MTRRHHVRLGLVLLAALTLSGCVVAPGPCCYYYGGYYGPPGPRVWVWR